MRVLLVDDSPAFLEVIARELAPDQAIEVIGAAGTLAGGLAAFERLEPDVIIADITLPDGSGLELTRRVLAASRHTVIVLVTLHDVAAYRAAGLEAGAVALIPKDEIDRLLLPLIVQLHAHPELARAAGKPTPEPS